MRTSKRYFVVRTPVSAGGGVEIASGVVPNTSPAYISSGEPSQGQYSLYKVPEGGAIPTGSDVCELSSEDARIVVQGSVFNGGGAPSTDYIAREAAECKKLRHVFMAAQSTLPLAVADALFTALEPTSHVLSAGSINLAYNRFQVAAVDQATKDAFNPLFEGFFKCFPRDLT